MRWISTRQPVTRTFSTTSRSRRWRPSKSSSSSDSGDAFGEAGESAAQTVLGRELGAALGERVSLLAELLAAGGERRGASRELVEVDQPSLVGVKQPGALALRGVERCVQALELRGDKLVLVRGAGDQGALGGDQLVGVKQRLADLFEDVLVELVGADVALGTAAVV